MAGAKGEKGDDGKPGVTPLDSCDRVRVNVSCWNIFSVARRLSVCRIITIFTNGAVDLFVVVLWQMQNGKPSFCIVSKFAWHDVRSYQSDMMPAVITYSLVCFQCLERLQREQATQAVVSWDHFQIPRIHTHSHRRMCTFPGVLCICLTGWPILHGNTRNSRITWITRNKRRVGESVTVFLMSILRLGMNQSIFSVLLLVSEDYEINLIPIKLLFCRLLLRNAFISFVLCYKFRAPLSYAAVLLHRIFSNDLTEIRSTFFFFSWTQGPPGERGQAGLPGNMVSLRQTSGFSNISAFCWFIPGSSWTLLLIVEKPECFA